MSNLSLFSGGGHRILALQKGNTMQEIKQFFINIGKGNIDENMDNLVEKGLLDSLGIMKLIQELESFYDIFIDVDYITPENFRNFATIKSMVEKIINE